MTDFRKSIFPFLLVLIGTTVQVVRGEAAQLASTSTAANNIITSDSTYETEPSSYYRGQRQTGYGFGGGYYQQPYYSGYNNQYYQRPYYNNYNQGYNTGYSGYNGYNTGYNGWGGGYQGGNYYSGYQRPYYNNYYSGGGGYGSGVGIFPQPVREGGYL